MDRDTLATLRQMIRPVTLRGAQTMERAASLASLNVEISRFHAAVDAAERILRISGTLDEGIQDELLARARRLGWLRDGMERSRAQHAPATGEPAPAIDA